MNYIDQLNTFWLLDAEHLFNGNESRLYFYLLKLSNSLYWKNPLTNADEYTAGVVGISVNTLKTARNRLQQAGLIQFKTGGNGRRDKCLYTLIPAAKVMEKGIDKVSEFDTFSNETLTPYPHPYPQKADDISKRKPDKTKIIPALAMPARKGGKKGKQEEQPEPYWDLLVKQWFLFNEKKFGGPPSFAGADPRHFKQIVQKLRARAAAERLEWTEQTAPGRVIGFLKRAYSEEWLSKNFLLKNLNDQFDKVILGQSQVAQKSKAPPPVAAGPKTMSQDLEYLYGRFVEGELVRLLIREEHYHQLVTWNVLPVGSMQKFEAPTHQEQMRLAVLDYFKRKAKQDGKA